MTRNTKIIIWSASIIALAGVGYYFYNRQQNKKYAEIYQKSIKQMTTQYQVFN